MSLKGSFKGTYKPFSSSATTAAIGFDVLESLGMDMDFDPSMTIELSALPQHE